MGFIDFVRTPRAVMLQNDFADNAALTYDAEGRQQSMELEILDVSKAKSVIWMVTKGVANDDDAMFNKGMLAIEYTMGWQSETMYHGFEYPDLGAGSFPAQFGGISKKSHKLHNKVMFLDKAVRAINLALDDTRTTYVGKNGVTPIDHLIDLINITGTWMLGSEDLEKFVKPGSIKVTNQTMSIISFLYGCGGLTGNTAMEDYAKNVLKQIFDSVLLPGSPGLIFPEKEIGTRFDSGYQTVSLHSLMDIWYRHPSGPFRDEIMDKLQKGWDKFMSKAVLPAPYSDPHPADAGRIDTTDNTRTGPHGDRVGPFTYPEGVIAKGIDISIMPYRLYMFDHILAGG